MTRRRRGRTIPVVRKNLAFADAGAHRVKHAHHPHPPDAVEALVTRYLRLARGLAGRYVGRGEPPEDLIQVANLGLVKAAQRYDERRGSCFVTYATHVINGELRRHLRDHAWTVHVPRSDKDRAVRVTTAARRERDRTGVDPSPGELGRRLGLSEREIADANEAWCAFRADSLDAPPSGRDDPDATRLSDRLGHFDSEYERVNGRLTRLVTMRGMSSLERRILYMRYVEDRTQRDIAAQVGLSQVGVSRTLGRILKRLDLAAA